MLIALLLQTRHSIACSQRMSGSVSLQAQFLHVISNGGIFMIAQHGLMRRLSCKDALLAAAPVPEVAIPDNIRHRQATQTIATAPEPNAWLVRTEWPAQMAVLQHGVKHPDHQSLVPRNTTAEELQPCFADPMKGSVMSLADCQAKYPHMQLVSQWCCHLRTRLQAVVFVPNNIVLPVQHQLLCVFTGMF